MEPQGARRRPYTPLITPSAHNFVKTTFYRPTLCSYCNDVMWWGTESFSCSQCLYSVHLECKNDAPAECLLGNRVADVEKQEKTISFNRKGIVKEGLLWKRVKDDSAWSQLWCICKPEALYFFRPKQRSLDYTSPLLVVGLPEQVDVGRTRGVREHCFMVYAGSETYTLAANSEQEVKEWKAAIKRREPSPDDVQSDEDQSTLSFVDIKGRSEQLPYLWEDLRCPLVKLLDTVAIERNEPIPKVFIPELSLHDADAIDKAEVAYFRTKAAKVVQTQNRRRQRLIISERTNDPLPKDFPDTFLAKLRMGKDDPGSCFRFSKNTNLQQMVIDNVLLPRLKVDMSVSWALPVVDDFIIQCGRLNEFIIDTDICLHSIVYVRNAIAKSEPIEFNVIPKTDPSLDLTSDNGLPPEEKSFCSLQGDTLLGFDFCSERYYWAHDLEKPFEIKVKRVENLREEIISTHFRWSRTQSVGVYVTLELVYGDSILTSAVNTQPTPWDKARWKEWLNTETLTMANIPRETVLRFTLYAQYHAFQSTGSAGLLGQLNQLFVVSQNVPVKLGTAEISYADFRGELRKGTQRLAMHLFAASRAVETSSAQQAEGAEDMALVVEFETKPVAFFEISQLLSMSEGDLKRMKPPQQLGEEGEEEAEPSHQHHACIYATIQRDSLYEMKPEEKRLLWKYKNYIRTKYPHALSRLLLAAPSADHQTIATIHSLLSQWTPLSPVHALELLSSRFPDSMVRNFAVASLRQLADRQLVEYMPQLIQVLKFELYHYSPLFELLFLRSVRSIVVGQPFFWHLYAESNTGPHGTRFKLMLEVFLSACEEDGMAEDLKKEVAAVSAFARVAKQLKTLPKNNRSPALQQELKKIELPKSFLLPDNPKFEVSNVKAEKCRVMDSMTSPLWLAFENNQKQTAHIIFKVGDDLRTDILTLQMIRIMDHLWRNEGLDLHMQPYRAVSTGMEEGLIEVITNSETTSRIAFLYGGGVAGAFSRTALKDWLLSVNSTELAQRSAINNLTLSCAGYCVATYILGIGDRHNDNIMVTYQGNLFHIDFAYFLGRRVTFAGIQRETAPFVLTPDIVEAMGGPGSQNFQSFKEHCCQAYNIIRKHGNLFITLFAMMLSSGISQLRNISDLTYIRNALALELTQEEAAKHFKTLIEASISNKVTQVNNAFHMLLHS